MDCLFCKIKNKEIEAKVLYEDDDFFVFLDMDQSYGGHTLIIPKKHINSLAELEDGDEKIIGKIYKKINDIAKEQGFIKQGYRVIVNCGKDAGQEVMHLHFHILAGQKLGPKIV